MSTPPRFAHRQTMRPGGFTLIELLVVLAIVALLVGILIPVLSSVRQSGYQAKSVNNLKQLAIAATAYLADHNGLYPGYTALNADGTPNYNVGWRYNAEFTNYLGIGRPETAPKNSPLFSGYPVKVSNSIGFNLTDMAANTSWAPPGSDPRTKLCFRATQITKPTRLILFAESSSQWFNMSTRTNWTPDVDQGLSSGQYIAYRATTNTKTIAVTYAGNILSFTKAESDDPELWHAFPQPGQ